VVPIAAEEVQRKRETRGKNHNSSAPAVAVPYPETLHAKVARETPVEGCKWYMINTLEEFLSMLCRHGREECRRDVYARTEGREREADDVEKSGVEASTLDLLNER
jgi:hypothetical protein